MSDIVRRRLALISVALIAALSMAAFAVPVAASPIGQSRHFSGKLVAPDRHSRTIKVGTPSRGELNLRVNQQASLEP